MENNQQGISNSPFLFISGRLFLDFVNTEIIRAGQWTDLMPDEDTLRAWLTEAELLPEDISEAAVMQALLLRAALRTIAQALSDGEAVSQASLKSINAVLSQNPVTRQVVRDEQTDAFHERFVTERADFASLLCRIAADAADLLCNGEHACVRQCENPQCILFFYDTTKNHARRWCRMNACGNRAKSAAHYQRRKQQK